MKTLECCGAHIACAHKEGDLASQLRQDVAPTQAAPKNAAILAEASKMQALSWNGLTENFLHLGSCRDYGLRFADKFTPAKKSREDAMSRIASLPLTGVERTFHDNEIIVTKTDAKGKICYANDIFVNISGYTEDELLGKPHNVIRHPDMPKAVFKLLWDQILSGDEVFAFVVNRSKNGDHYWVFAHVTPNFGQDGAIVGFHSSRRVAKPGALRVIKPIYERLRQIERSANDAQSGLKASLAQLHADIAAANFADYDRFVHAISR